MALLPVDVPAYVEHAPHVENQVLVEGGTNWDLSRSARVTPIVPLPDPEPIRPATIAANPVTAEEELDAVPADPAVHVVSFSIDGVTLQNQEKTALAKLPKATRWIVVAHADSHESDGDMLSRARAEAVVRFLKDRGFVVTQVKALGSSPVRSTAANRTHNRVVEIFKDSVPPP